MKLWNNQEFKVWVGDIETLRGFTLLKFYNPDTGEWLKFEVSSEENTLKEFAGWYNIENIDYVCGFNWIDFDGVIIHWILKNYEGWKGLEYSDITKHIYEYVQLHLDNRRYKKAAEFREYHFTVPCIDVYTILGLDNEARRSSLKKCEFQIDWHNVEEMPISHEKEELSLQELELVRNYCKNDILATNELLKICIGETEHPIYSGNNQLELRDSIQKEFNLECRNLSDIRLGDELMRLSYATQIGEKISDLPRKGTFRKEIHLRYCLPKYIEFQTPILKKLHEDIKKACVKQTDDWKRSIVVGNTEYIQAFGGLHSTNENQIFTESEDCEIVTCDVSSMYPATLVNNQIYPLHLGKELLKVYTDIFNKRIEIKPLIKTDKRIKGISDAFKLLLNSCFGKLGMMESWLYDKKALLGVTLTGQLSLLMLIEKLESAGFRVIIGNTDGLECMVAKNRKEEYNQICKEWENITGYTLEFDTYSKIYMSTVNDYIAVTTSGKVKQKGEFLTEFELWKNKSARIVPLALKAYFIDNIDPISFIRNHNNIFDFCIMARATGNLYLEEQSRTEIKTYKKLVRYYLSNNSDSKLYKRGIGSTGKKMNVCLNADNELGEIYIQYYNKHEVKEMKDYHINYNQYIYRTLKIISKLEKNTKDTNFVNFVNNTTQLLLF